MKRIVVMLFFICTTFIFGAIEDKIKLLTPDDMEILTKRVELLKKDYGVNFDIVISNSEENLEKNLNNKTKNVIINLIKPDDGSKIKLKLKFSEDIDVVGYREDIDEMLVKIESLITDKNYLDMLYELTGNIAVDVINLSEYEKKQAMEGNVYKSLSGIFFILAIITGIFTLFLYWARYMARRVHKCKTCGIDMVLTDTTEEGNKKIKEYTCKICGNKKKVTTVRR